MAKQRRIPGKPIRRSYDRSNNGGNSSSRSELRGVMPGEILENVVKDVLETGDRTGFQGTVDVQLDLTSTEIDNNGFLVSLFSGRDPKSSSVAVKLATRIHLGDQGVASEVSIK